MLRRRTPGHHDQTVASEVPRYPHLDRLLPVQELLHSTGLYEEGIRVGPADLCVWDDWDDLLGWSAEDLPGRLRDAARTILAAAHEQGTGLPDAWLLLPVPKQPGRDDPARAWAGEETVAALRLSGGGEVGVAVVEMITRPGW
jgi:hypothetical protein